MPKPKHTNELIHESSPYLLQHAHNPVNWKAWNKGSLDLAMKEQKLLIISVGYSACHWCHVMEHESFEDPEVATTMNADYISIKVDREERPDIDQVYMQAVQVMTGRGGWPMNIIALPDGRPVWGGTYFTKEQWISALHQVQHLYKTEPQRLIDYAEKLEEGLQQMNIIDIPDTQEIFSQEHLIEIIEVWKPNLDFRHGGKRGAPKFMMPSNLDFLLRYAYQSKDEELQAYVLQSLNKISYGGTFDHIGGGFARYSVDEKWHVPHFEKMLYDNAQLLGLYSKAFKLTRDPWYRHILEKTADFILGELSGHKGIFYSALDADSQNSSGKQEEGAYYTWKKEELQQLLGGDFELFAAYFNINPTGYWEDGNYILYKTLSDQEFLQEHQLSMQALEQKRKDWTDLLSRKRSLRKPPALDDKTLTSWNAMTITGLAHAYSATGNQKYLEAAVKNAEFILSSQLQRDYTLFHSFKKGIGKINGYLEDYAFTIEAFLRLHEVTLDKKWTVYAEKLLEITLEHFYHPDIGLFHFVASRDHELITNPIEYHDNVIPASNSVMANNLFEMGSLLSNTYYSKVAEKMLQVVHSKIRSYPMGFSHWLQLYMNFSHPFYELVITGEHARERIFQTQQHYLPNLLITGSSWPSSRPLTKHRYVEGKTLFYLCSQGRCDLPESDLDIVLSKIQLL